MNIRTVKAPSTDHPITIRPINGRVTVIFNGKVIASSSDALVLYEADYAPVHYIPRKDVEMANLMRSEHTSYCPYKGDANYYNVAVDDKQSANAVWTYESPFFSVAAIQDYLAFYPGRVDSIQIES